MTLKSIASIFGASILLSASAHAGNRHGHHDSYDSEHHGGHYQDHHKSHHRRHHSHKPRRHACRHKSHYRAVRFDPRYELDMRFGIPGGDAIIVYRARPQRSWGY